MQCSGLVGSEAVIYRPAASTLDRERVDGKAYIRRVFDLMRRDAGNMHAPILSRSQGDGDGHEVPLSWRHTNATDECAQRRYVRRVVSIATLAPRPSLVVLYR